MLLANSIYNTFPSDIYIYIYECERIDLLQDDAPLEIEHIFSVEIDKRKRDLILAEHRPRHMFADVSVFQKMYGFCHVCQTDHKIEASNCGHDVLVAGTSCKDLSRLNNNRRDSVGCFERTESDEQSGSSGPTYLYGFRKAGLL